jgi:glycosyltransferase involved in cell wall biosynthesis
MNSKMIDFVLLIPCYNNITGLSVSLKSICYPPDKFEVLIIDDGSEVPVAKNNLQLQDAALNITIIRLDRNQGIVHALNAGLSVLKSRTDLKYIARLDAGDTCDVRRFQKQVEFLNQHQDIALLASWARFQDVTLTKAYDYITKITHEEIAKEMHYKCSFIHPSVMFRKQVLEDVGMYPINYPNAEDYAFFWTILKKYKGAVLSEKLVKIVYSNKTVSNENYKNQLRSRKKIVKTFGDRWLQKMIGVGMLNLKLIIPQAIIQKLKIA